MLYFDGFNMELTEWHRLQHINFCSPAHLNIMQHFYRYKELDPDVLNQNQSSEISGTKGRTTEKERREKNFEDKEEDGQKKVETFDYSYVLTPKGYGRQLQFHDAMAQPQISGGRNLEELQKEINLENLPENNDGNDSSNSEFKNIPEINSNYHTRY
ncbi:hypothetical protein JTB14_013204 [Gonioctena quinquepunctata]|nr:hypothetical protein JTB14_013204 [Gonioctena quinquepunctata]